MDSKQLSITLLGTGCPVVSTTRYGAANLVRCGELTLLVDVGSGATQRLLQAGSNGAEIDALLLTHLHSDHLVDLYQFVISSWHQHRDRPHKIYGPPGTRAFVQAQMDAWREERELRIAFEQRQTTAPFDIEVIEFSNTGALLEQNGARITAIRVEHEPVEYAFGFVFELGAQKLVLSGDTKRCDALIEAAQGADVLVHEVYQHGRQNADAGTRTTTTLRNVASYHTLSTEVGEVARTAKVGALVLTHIVPPSADPVQLLDDIRAEYAGLAVVGEDLMNINVAARQITWSGASLAF